MKKFSEGCSLDRNFMENPNLLSVLKINHAIFQARVKLSGARNWWDLIKNRLQIRILRPRLPPDPLQKTMKNRRIGRKLTCKIEKVPPHRPFKLGPKIAFLKCHEKIF